MVRLSGALQSGEWQNVLGGGDQPERDIGRILMQLRALSADQLRTVVRSAVVDAIIVLTVPLADESFVSDIRFQAPGAHWAGAYSRLPVDSIRAEAVRRAQWLARYRVARTAPVALRDLDRASVLLRPAPWAIACRINGALSTQDLARQCGLALYETIEGVGELLQAGLCTLTPAAPAVPPAANALKAPAPESPVPVNPRPALAIGRPPASGPGEEVAVPTPTLPAPELPEPRLPERRLPERRLPTSRLPETRPKRELEARTVPAQDAGPEAAPPPELLRRVLEGLRKLG
jgi:hypothetical protein